MTYKVVAIEQNKLFGRKMKPADLEKGNKWGSV